jgi:hypothetical protein
MPDMSLIAGAVSSLKLAQDMTKALVSIRDFSKLNETVIELQRVIVAAQSDALAAQSDQFSMLERVRDLETEITRLKAWDAEKQKYELKDIGEGAFVYVRKEDAEPHEPPHWLCTKCYRDGKGSILLRTESRMGFGKVLWSCPSAPPQYPSITGSHRVNRSDHHRRH